MTTATGRFEACLKHVLEYEGYYSNDPHDPGGATMRGVTQRVYDAWRERQGKPRQAVKEITRDEIEAIYRANYWAVVRAGELPVGLDLCVFDFAVNSGPARAARHLQAVLGVRVDGHIGDVTLDAARRGDAVKAINELSASRLKFLRGLKTFWRFGRGWMARVQGTRASALSLVSTDVAAPAAPPVPAPGKAVATPPRTMAGSKIGNVSVGITLTSLIAGGYALFGLIDAELADGSFSIATFVASLIARPDITSVIVAAFTAVTGGPFIWLERQAKLIGERI